MFVGKMCSGKTTYANIAKKVFGHEVISLASPIKRIVNDLENSEEILEKEIFPYLDLSSMQKQVMYAVCEHTKSIPSKGPKFRERLQYLGTDGARDKVDQNIWINYLLNKTASTTDKYWAVDDVRFINEFEALKNSFNAVLIMVSPEVQKARIEKLYGGFDPNVLVHASELPEQTIKQLSMDYQDISLMLSGDENLPDAEAKLIAWIQK